jgi:hypothetical protein
MSANRIHLKMVTQKRAHDRSLNGAFNNNSGYFTICTQETADLM